MFRAMLLDYRKLLANDPTTTKAFHQIIDVCLRRYLKDESRIREVAQSAMTEALQKLGAGAAPKPEYMITWLINCAGNALRRELTQVRRQMDSYESRLHSQPTFDASELLDVNLEIDRIEQLLELCNVHDRLVLMAKIRGDTTEEIAATYGKTPAAVRSSISRTRQRLRLGLTPEQKRQRLIGCVRRAVHEHPSRFRAKRDSNS